MKKLLVLLFASLLVLGACGQKEETTSKEETTKKSDSKDEKKDKSEKEDKTKKNEDKESAEKSEPKTEEQSTEEVTTEEPQSIEEDTTEQPTQEQQTIEQPAQQEQQNNEQEEIYNPAREQVINEGIDMDNPTDAEIKRMRELAKDSPHGLQSAPSQGNQQENNDGHEYHYDPEYDRYGYTGMVDEEGMPVLDPNENFDPHGGQVPNDNLTEEEIRDMMD